MCHYLSLGCIVHMWAFWSITGEQDGMKEGNKGMGTGMISVVLWLSHPGDTGQNNWILLNSRIPVLHSGSPHTSSVVCVVLALFPFSLHSKQLVGSLAFSTLGVLEGQKQRQLEVSGAPCPPSFKA